VVYCGHPHSSMRHLHFSAILLTLVLVACSSGTGRPEVRFEAVPDEQGVNGMKGTLVVLP
jgi:hypothetical protein